MDAISLGNLEEQIEQINDMGWTCIKCKWLNHQSDTICNNCGAPKTSKGGK